MLKHPCKLATAYHGICCIFIEIKSDRKCRKSFFRTLSLTKARDHAFIEIKLSICGKSGGSSEILEVTFALAMGKIFIWSTPRSGSTVLEHALRQGPNTAGFHEPWLESFYLGPERGSTIFEDLTEVMEEHANHTYEVAAARLEGLLDEFKDKHVVIKDLSFYHLDDPPEYLKTGDFLHVVLMRHPVICADSQNRAYDGAWLPEREFGYDGQKRIVDWCRRNQLRFHVVDLESLVKDPETHITRICTKAQVPFVPEMLHWQPGIVRPDLARSVKLFPTFYGSVINSTGFSAPKHPKNPDTLYATVPDFLKQYVDRAIPIYHDIISSNYS